MFDLAIIGSGFAGALTALIARRLGRSVILLERGQHPRFVIGESSTPLANLLWEELTRRYELPRLAPLSNWGDWQRTYPEIACGLKRGFTFYHHHDSQPFADPMRQRQLLVGASPRDIDADTHWYRPDFDHFLVREAQREGAEFVDQVKLERVQFTPAAVELEGNRGQDGQTVRKSFKVRVRFVVDATGHRGFLHQALGLTEEPLLAMPSTAALYSHFEGVKPLADLAAFSSTEQPPFPIDAAAVHHVFAGGWIWVLRFNNGITSAGAATTHARAGQFQFADGAAAWARLLKRFPSVHEQFADARPCHAFVHSARLGFRSGQVAGPQWALLPSAAGFVDPLLSSGFPLTLLGLQRLSVILGEQWESADRSDHLATYARTTLKELDVTATLVGALYASMNQFDLFAAVSLLYFAAAIYAETARRNGHATLASSFMLHDHPSFGPESWNCLCRVLRRSSHEPASTLIAAIQRAIEPINLAGLGDPACRNWYPARDLHWKSLSRA